MYEVKSAVVRRLVTLCKSGGNELWQVCEDAGMYCSAGISLAGMVCICMHAPARECMRVLDTMKPGPFS